MYHQFKQLKVWQRARFLVKEVYVLSAKFPREELFGITQQVRKSAVSIVSNIAEGCGRGSDAQLVHFLDVAQGSAFELEAQLLICLDLAYVLEGDLELVFSDLNEIQKMIRAFKQKIQKQME